MPQPSSIRHHPERHAIDCALAAGTPKRRVATRFGLSEAAVRRYFQDHLPRSLVAAQAAEDACRADDVFSEIGFWEANARHALALAKEAGNVKGINDAVRTGLNCVALKARIRGELDRDYVPPTEDNPVFARMQRQEAMATVAGRMLQVLAQMRTGTAAQTIDGTAVQAPQVSQECPPALDPASPPSPAILASLVDPAPATASPAPPAQPTHRRR